MGEIRDLREKKLKRKEMTITKN